MPYKNRERKLAYDRAYHWSHREKQLRKSQEWRNEHRERFLTGMKNWYEENREQIRKYRQSHKEEHNLYVAKRRKQVKILLLKILGSKCNCGFSDYRALEIHHPEKSVKVRDKQRFKANITMYRYYLKHPEEAKINLQILCANCHSMLRYRDENVE